MMKQFTIAICAALLFTLGFASPVAAQICSDGEVLIVASRLAGEPGGSNGHDFTTLHVNFGGNGPNGQVYYDQLVASDAFTRGGALYGFKPNSNFAPLGEFADSLSGRGRWYLAFRSGAQLLRCSTAKKLSTEAWRRYCGDETSTFATIDKFVPVIYVLSGKTVRPFDMDKLPINPLQCSDPARRSAIGPTGWTPIEPPGEGQSAITYRGQAMAPGEEVTLIYSGTQKSNGNYGGKIWPTSTSKIVFLIALTSGDQPIIGFDGISLRDGRNGRDLETFYSTTSKDYDLYHFSDAERCGTFTLGGLSEETQARCSYQCFRTRAELASQRGATSCENGDARWIMVIVAGELSEKRKLDPGESDESRVQKMLDQEAAQRARRGELSLTEKVDRASLLAVQVKWKGSESVTLPIDDLFRTSLWDPKK